MQRLPPSQQHRRLVTPDDHDLRPVRLDFVDLVRRAFIFSIGALMVGCSTRVEHFTDQPYSPREKDVHVEWLSGEPIQPHIELARITVSSTLASDDTLRQRILDRARQLGADAVVAEVTAVVASRTPSPYYEPGLLGPMGAAFGLYGYGWYTPYSSNPFLFTQGAVDQPRLDKYLSGMAIRYQKETSTNESP